MNRRETLFLAAFLTLLSAAPAGRKALARASTPVVHAVLFHSPMCSFCEEIIEVKLPPQIKKYGTQLEILLVNIESQAGIALYKAALEAYGVDGGIPVLFLADLVLRGNAIPEELPAIVDSFLAQNGADWPAIPGLEEYRESLLATATPRPTIGLPSATPALTVAPSVAADTVARAVLFFSPTCSHCRHVQEDILPGLEKRFGKQLEIVSINTYLEEGYALYQAALSLFHLERAGVPFLVIGDRYLRGSTEIGESFSALIEQALADGGVDWPAIPGLPEWIQASAPPDTAGINAGILARIRTNVQRDPLGNGISILLFLGMLLTAGTATARICGFSTPDTRRIPDWAIPLLCVLGMGVAGYLAYVEVGNVEAVCGPVGDCNTVQQSSYARLFGILPVGVLGIFGYLFLLGAWITGRAARGRAANLADLAFFLAAAFGFLFSIYLTFLEPFVIGASCIWCHTSAVLMTALFWLSLPRGMAAVDAQARRGRPNFTEGS